MELSAAQPEILDEAQSERPGEPLPLEGWLGSTARPLVIDMGCHKGLFLIEMAQLFPEQNFLGIERQSERVARTRRKIERLRLANARVARTDGELAFLELPDASVEGIHILFPDPWPKRRHHIRRLVREEFLFQCARVLKVGGLLRIVTDDPSYATAIRVAVEDGPPWFQEEAADLTAYPATEFQKKFIEIGRPAHPLHLRRNSETAMAGG